MEKALAGKRKNSFVNSTFHGVHFDDKSSFVMPVKSPTYKGTHCKDKDELFSICNAIVEYNMINCATSDYHYNCTKVQSTKKE